MQPTSLPLNSPGHWAFALVAMLWAASGAITRGALNANAATNAALVQEILHSPRQPRSNQAVTISARLGSAIKMATLEYQTVDPGNYISLKDPDYKTRWVSIPMTNTIAGAEIRCAVEIPGSIQTHRRIVRYRFKTTDAQGRNASTPAQDSSEPNFAYFVYDGIPPWKAAIEPKSNDPRRSELVQFGSNVMDQVQTYFLIGKKKEVENATWHRPSSGKEYLQTGTLVADGRVYDHVGYRARGGVWRHAMGKNMWKFDFNKDNRLQAKDDYGRNYKTVWNKLNLRSCIQQGDYGRRGEQGMYEAVGFRLFNLAGVEAPRTHWISLRIIDEKAENSPDQYQGDYWGLYLAIENEDGRFLKEHGLPDGNVYKMMYGQGELSNQGANQVTNHSDLLKLIAGIRRNNQTEDWWRTHTDLPRYYSYRSIIEAIHHYDVSDGKNYDFYLNPETGKWSAIPWDIDLTWGDHMYGGGHEPFQFPVLSRPAFKLEYQNRLREIRDLLFNPDETNRLIDDYAALISKPKGSPSIVDADRAKWDYHPIMASRYVMQMKAGQGLFYQATRTGDFQGMVRQMKDYVKRRASFIDNSLLADPAIPTTPSITYTGSPGYPTNALSFSSSPFVGTGRFAAMKWRLGEIDPPRSPQTKPTAPGHYEITALWETGELPEFKQSVTLPAETVKTGQTYRVRVRMKDHAGRWSHWSPPIQFVAGPTKN